MAFQLVTASRGSQGQLNITPTQVRRPSARGPRVVSRKVSALMGLADYSQIDPTSGARVSYSGTPPGTSSPPARIGRGGAPSYPDGTLLQGVGQSATYLVQDGQAHWIPDFATFTAMGFQTSEITRNVPLNVLNQMVGAPLPTLAAPTPAPTQVSTPAPTSTSTSSQAGTVAATLEAGASYNATYGYWVNPDGSIYYPQTSSGNYVASTGSVSAVLQPGATYNASTGYYTNPDGTIYYPATATFDITSPSTWPTWVWLALTAGGAWLVLFKKR